MSTRLLAAAVAFAAFALLAPATALAHAQTKRCGTITVSNGVFTLTTNGVTCRQARRVLRAVNASPGRAEGFRCSYRNAGGTYTVTCRKGAKRIRARLGGSAGDGG